MSKKILANHYFATDVGASLWAFRAGLTPDHTTQQNQDLAQTYSARTFELRGPISDATLRRIYTTPPPNPDTPYWTTFSYLTAMRQSYAPTYQPVFHENGPGHQPNLLKLALAAGFRCFGVELHSGSRDALHQQLVAEAPGPAWAVCAPDDSLLTENPADVCVWNTVPLPLYPNPGIRSFWDSGQFNYWDYMTRHLKPPTHQRPSFLISVLDGSAIGDLRETNGDGTQTIIGSRDPYNFAPPPNNREMWTLIDRMQNNDGGRLFPSDHQLRQHVSIFSRRHVTPLSHPLRSTTNTFRIASLGLKFLRKARV